MAILKATETWQGLSVGDTVVALQDISEGLPSRFPGGLRCKRGETLVIRSIIPRLLFPFDVSYENTPNDTFGVAREEIRHVSAP